MPKVLTWKDWLTLSDSELGEGGHDPSYRVRNCGHDRALPQWLADTVGLWGYRGVHPLAWANSRNHYDTTVKRWGLSRDRTSVTEVAFGAWELLCAFAGEHPGAAAYGCRSLFRKPRVGVLPVEGLLYYQQINNILRDAGESPEAWYLWGISARMEAWNDLSLPPPFIPGSPTSPPRAPGTQASKR